MRINLFAQDVRDLRQTARRMRDTLVSSNCTSLTILPTISTSRRRL